MISILSLITLLSIINNSQSFELGYWRGTTYSYFKGYNENKINFNKPQTTIYSRFDLLNLLDTYKINKINNSVPLLDDNYLHLQLQSYDKIGGVIVKVKKEVDFNNDFTNEINFFYNSARSIITFSYKKIIDRYKLDLSSVHISAFRCGLVKSYSNREKLYNLTTIIDKVNKWSYCKTTFINTKTPNDKKISFTNEYDYKHLLINEKRITQIFTDNIVISLPKTIDDYKPFSLLIGCLISSNCYKQLNLNYNFNGVLISIEFNEYEPYQLRNTH